MPFPAFFGDDDQPALADAGTPADLLKKKFPGMFPDAAAGNGNAGAIPLFGGPTRPASTPAAPADVPDIGQPSFDNYSLPWMRQFRPQEQPQRPPLTTPTGQLVPGATKGQMLAVLLRSGLQGALAGRAASEQAVIQSGGRRSGGAGLGFQAGMEQPLIQASQQQQFQRGAMQNQITQQQLAQTQALNAAYAAGTTKDPQTGAPSFDRQKVIQSLAASGQGALIPGLTETFAKMDKTAGELQAQRDTHAKAEDEYVGAALAGIRSANYDPAVAGATLSHLAQHYPEQAESLRRAIAANPSALKQIVDTAIAQSPTQQKLSNEAWKTVDGRLVNTQTGATMGEALPVDQLNAGLLQRYQVLNPGAQLPASFTLPPNATAKDFDRVDKLMQQTEQGQATKALRDQSAAIRNQTLSMAQQNQQDREEK